MNCLTGWVLNEYHIKFADGYLKRPKSEIWNASEHRAASTRAFLIVMRSTPIIRKRENCSLRPHLNSFPQILSLPSSKMHTTNPKTPLNEHIIGAAHAALTTPALIPAAEDPPCGPKVYQETLFTPSSLVPRPNTCQYRPLRQFFQEESEKSDKCSGATQIEDVINSMM